MEKAVKIQGQNVVVIIEPDPSLADASLAADAIAALDSIHQADHTSIQVGQLYNNICIEVMQDWPFTSNSLARSRGLIILFVNVFLLDILWSLQPSCTQGLEIWRESIHSKILVKSVQHKCESTWICVETSTL